MKIFTKSIFLSFLITATFSLPSNAVVDYKPDTDKKTNIVKKNKKAKKKGFLKRWKVNFILKKLKKLQKKVDDKAISKTANKSLVVGASSAVSLVAGALTAFSNISILPALFLIGSIFLTIFGIILSLGVLRRTKHDKEKFRKERKKAFLGLFLSLLIIIIPTLVFFSFA